MRMNIPMIKKVFNETKFIILNVKPKHEKSTWNTRYITSQYNFICNYVCPYCLTEYTDEFNGSLHAIKNCTCNMTGRRKATNRQQYLYLKYTKNIKELAAENKLKIINIKNIDEKSTQTSIVIDFKCKKCGEINTLTYSDFIKYVESGCTLTNTCCRAQFFNIKNNRDIIIRNNFNPVLIFNEEGQEFVRTGVYEAICKNKHKFILRIPKNPHCKICDAVQKYEFFKILKELNVIYRIIEDSPRTRDGIKHTMKEISNFVVYTYNKKKHLTGKIVFNDIFGDKQAKANSNKLVFRWFNNYEKLNDRNYCLTYLNDFFEEIVKRNHIIEKLKEDT